MDWKKMEKKEEKQTRITQEKLYCRNSIMRHFQNNSSIDIRYKKVTDLEQTLLLM